VAKKVPSSLKIHGVELKDDYAWLRSRDEALPKPIMDYISAENKYTDGSYIASFEVIPAS
jgi:protease II